MVIDTVTTMGTTTVTNYGDRHRSWTLSTPGGHSNEKRIGRQFRSQSFFIYRVVLVDFFDTLTTLYRLAANPPQSMTIPTIIIVIALADMLSNLLL
jgi:hypothetical protein